jgi:hypothetical protein
MEAMAAELQGDRAACLLSTGTHPLPSAASQGDSGPAVVTGSRQGRNLSGEHQTLGWSFTGHVAPQVNSGNSQASGVLL